MAATVYMVITSEVVILQVKSTEREASVATPDVRTPMAPRDAQPAPKVKYDTGANKPKTSKNQPTVSVSEKVCALIFRAPSAKNRLKVLCSIWFLTS